MTTQVDTNYLSLVGSKLRNQMTSQLNESSGSNVAAFAKAHLEKMGWKEGEGLGKRRKGMTTHIKVIKRAEGLGLGESTLDPAIHQSLNANDWWKHSVGDTLAKLAAANKNKKKKQKKNKKKRSSSSGSDDDDDVDTDNKSKSKSSKKRVYTDEELFEATGGARFGMRAQTQQHAKWKRAESNISIEEEEQAKRQVEWDGITAPKLLLLDSSSSNSKKKKEKDQDKTNDNTTTTTSSKKTKEMDLVVVNDTDKDKDTDSSSKQEQKRQKKDKKKRKRKEQEDDDDDDDDENNNNNNKEELEQEVTVEENESLSLLSVEEESSKKKSKKSKKKKQKVVSTED